MDFDTLRALCLALPATTEGLPYDEDTLAFSVAGKQFALLSIAGPSSVNLKCDPDWALELRAAHAGIVPGYHMNKRHWNTVALTGSVPLPLVRALVVHSYALVRAGLPKKLQAALPPLPSELAAYAAPSGWPVPTGLPPN